MIAAKLHFASTWRQIGLCAALLLVPGCAGKTPEPRIRKAEDVLPIVREASARHQVPVPLILGVIHVESSFRPDAESKVGARGLMQLMPATAEALAERLDWGDYEIIDPVFNVNAGTAYLAYLLRIFGGKEKWALAGYQTGPTRVLRWRRQGKDLAGYSQRYAGAVLAARDRYRRYGGQSTEPPVGTPNEEDREALRQLLRQELAGSGTDAPDADPPR